MQESRYERVLGDVDRGIRRRERYRNQPAGCNEAEQNQHEQLSPPEGEQPLEHGDRSLSVRTLLCDAPVHRQSTKEGEQDYEQSSYGRERPSGQGRDAWYVA